MTYTEANNEAARAVLTLVHQRNLLLDAAKEFIARVEIGEVRSVKSYARFKDAVRECERP